MQRKKAVEIRERWGATPCDHPDFAREYDHGERTGNYCCTQCGTSVTFRERGEILAARATSRPSPTAE